MAKRKQIWIDEKMYFLLTRAKKDLSNEMSRKGYPVRLNMVEVSRILANRLESSEVKVRPPKPKKREWIFDVEFNPRF